ncbi:Hypothetical protein zj316_2p19 (plasmid) [Lactobacillus plantarum ZJ316] [Lactiplantibacillus mudanjiangensis]|uniref:phage holin, LLH family n=1 Tax=Lactiplantibacillus mudanjiangensis TaxID=1296538 RepID=UPI0010158F49|nr:phage holin, LLH family [Lactiplantibacillus mudanjiangensis]VDG31426.1 Hypothetical protein zj316_2p19 (plasmid) [Lactobacillus plantarum ZJ316] [Lactiplantibacillus mudanjiangensis]
MMKLVNDVFSWLVNGGATVIAVIGGTIAVKAWPLVHKILDNKEATTKSAKTKQHYEQLEQWAGTAVAAVSVNLDAMGADKKKEAVRIVNQQLADHKIDINVENVANAVEAAYQAFKATQPVKLTAVSNSVAHVAKGGMVDTTKIATVSDGKEIAIPATKDTED